MPPGRRCYRADRKLCEMKLLVISNNPGRASFRQRIGVYMGTMRRAGIDCEVVKLPAGSLARLTLFKQAANFDGILLHKKKLNFFDSRRLRRYSKKIIYDFDDAVMCSPKAPQRRSFLRLRAFRRTVKLADMVIAGNKYLAEHALRFNPHVEVLPTGLDTTAYRVDAGPKNDGRIRLVWIGSGSTLKYLAEIKPALEEVGSRFENVILRIICDDFFELQNMPLEKQRWSEATQAIDLAASDIGLAPLPDNRFTRGKCGFKILQYASAGLPVVASPVGVNAEYVNDSITGFHATSIPQWIESISRLTKSEELRKNMSLAARRQVQKFDLSAVGKGLLNIIENCIAQNIQTKSAQNPK